MRRPLLIVSWASLRNFAGRMSFLDTKIAAGNTFDNLSKQNLTLPIHMFNTFLAQFSFVPLAVGKRCFPCFLQQRTYLAIRIGLGRLNKGVQRVMLYRFPCDWLYHPQLEAALFDAHDNL